MNGEHDLGSVSPPLGPCECRKVNVARNVQNVRFERAGLPDDVPSVQPAFTEACCLSPSWLWRFWPCFGHLLKRLLDAKVAEGTFFAKEPGDMHAGKINAPNGCGFCLKGLFR